MVKLIHLALIAVVIFVLTYDPKSGTLTNFINNTQTDKKPVITKCCDDPKCVAKHPNQCKNVNYESIQFAGDVPSGFAYSNGKSWDGAILSA